MNFNKDLDIRRLCIFFCGQLILCSIVVIHYGINILNIFVLNVEATDTFSFVIFKVNLSYTSIFGITQF